jgi:hypothetical protein
MIILARGQAICYIHIDSLGYFYNHEKDKT